MTQQPQTICSGTRWLPHSRKLVFLPALILFSSFWISIYGQSVGDRVKEDQPDYSEESIFDQGPQPFTGPDDGDRPFPAVDDSRAGVPLQSKQAVNTRSLPSNIPPPPTNIPPPPTTRPPSFPGPGSTSVSRVSPTMSASQGTRSPTGSIYDPEPEAIFTDYEIADMGVSEMLDTLEELTGKSILRKQNLPNVKITFKGQGDLTQSELILALESLLSINGITVMPVGEKFLKAVPAPSAANEVPVMLEGSTLGMIPTEKIFTKFFKLDYLTTEEAVKLIQPLMSQGTPVLFEKANALMITDPLNNLQRIEEILLANDRNPGLGKDILYFDLKHVSAEEMAKRLEEMQGGSLKNLLENNTTFEPDERTSQLIVFTHKSNAELIQQLVERLDKDVAPLTRTEIFSIKHAQAEDVAALIEEVITGQQQAREEQERAARGSSRTARRTPTQTPTPAGQSGEGGARSLQFSDYITIVPDPRSNAIVASGTDNDLVALEELIGKIDVLLAQVRIEVVVSEVNLGDDQASGLSSFGVVHNRGDAPDDEVLLLPGLNALEGKDLALGPITLKDFSIEAVLAVAKEKSNVTVLSTPTIVTTHNQEATIAVGRRQPIITSTTSDLTTTSTTRSSISYENIGIELKVKPLIGSNGVIQMEIDQKIESVVDTTTIDNNVQPIIGNRQATSFLSVGNNELIILGGLQEYNINDTRGKHWILGDVPIIGWLLNPKTITKDRKELIIFIKPTILNNTHEAQQDALRSIERRPDAEALKTVVNGGEVNIDMLEEMTFGGEEEAEEPEEDVTVERFRTRSRR